MQIGQVGWLSCISDDHFTPPLSLKQPNDEVELPFKHQNLNNPTFEMLKLPIVFQMDDESNEFLFKEKCNAKEDEELSHNF